LKIWMKYRNQMPNIYSYFEMNRLNKMDWFLWDQEKIEIRKIDLIIDHEN